MLRGNNANNIECTTTPGDDDSNDDNVSLECADSGLGLTSDQDAADRVVPRPAPDNGVWVPASSVTAGYRPPVLTSTPADTRRGLTDRQPVH